MDYVILGASHAMPLDFGDSNVLLQRAAGVRVLEVFLLLTDADDHLVERPGEGADHVRAADLDLVV